MLKETLAALAAFIAFATPTIAHDYTAGGIEIDRPWSRPTPPSARVAGGYVTLKNVGSEPDRLIEVTSPIAERVEIHRSDIENGVASMRPLDAVTIEPGATSTSRRSACTSCSSHLIGRCETATAFPRRSSSRMLAASTSSSWCRCGRPSLRRETIPATAARNEWREDFPNRDVGGENTSAARAVAASSALSGPTRTSSAMIAIEEARAGERCDPLHRLFDQHTAEQGISPASVEEVREIQTALGIVAAGVSLCVIPAAAGKGSHLSRPEL